MAKIEKIGNIQIVDNKEDKFFYFPMISMACTGEEYRIDGQPPLQFYDMVNDPEEKVNQINNPEYAGRIREMAARVKKYIEDGRSTPGAKAANDGGNSWKQITDIMSGLYAGNR